MKRLIRIGLICSHGGHLTEMMELLDACTGYELFFVTYKSQRARELERDFRVYTMTNIGANPLRLLLGFGSALRILNRERPDILLSTGSEIAIPFFLLAKGMGIKTMFIESVCRVKTASKTGKLVYPFANVFLVQWPELLQVYGSRASYKGGLL